MLRQAKGGGENGFYYQKFTPTYLDNFRCPNFRQPKIIVHISGYLSNSRWFDRSRDSKVLASLLNLKRFKFFLKFLGIL